MTIPYPFTKGLTSSFSKHDCIRAISITPCNVLEVESRHPTGEKPSSCPLLGNLLFCKIYVKKFRQTFMPLHKQCLGVYQNKCICLSSGNQSCGCNSLSKGCRCRQHTVGKWHEGIDRVQLFIAFFSFECYANRFTMICIINYFIINFEGIQHVDNGILTPPRHCKIFIGKICTADNTRNVIYGNTHRLFAVKFWILNAAICFK